MSPNASDQRVVTAHHEAAHAVVLYRTAGHVGGKVTIRPQPDEYGMVLGCAEDGVWDSSSKDDTEATVLSLYAGGHAQRLLDPATTNDGCGGDDEQAADLLQEWDWRAREQELREKSYALTQQHWDEITAVASELLRFVTLDGTEVEILADAAAGDTEALSHLQQLRWLALEDLNRLPGRAILLRPDDLRSVRNEYGTDPS